MFTDLRAFRSVQQVNHVIVIELFQWILYGCVLYVKQNDIVAINLTFQVPQKNKLTYKHKGKVELLFTCTIV